MNAKERRQLRVNGIVGHPGPQSYIAWHQESPPAVHLGAELHALESAEVERLAPGRVSFNPSIVVHRGELIVSLRRANADAKLVIARLGDDWRMQDPHVAAEAIAPSGIEDARLISYRDRLMFSATVHRLSPDWRCKIVVGSLDEAGDVARADVQPTRKVEKNWMPCVDGEALRFVYSMEPLQVVEWDQSVHRTVPSAWDLPGATGVLRGGSQLLPFEEGWLAVVHERSARGYVHRFARFDRELRRFAVGPCWYFTQPDTIEFCCGAAWWRGQLVLTFGVADRTAHLALVDEARVRELSP